MSGLKTLDCSTWKFILDVIEHGYASEYVLAMSYAFTRSRAVRFLQNARDYDVLDEGQYASFVAQRLSV